jgi:hypothetical protein
MYEQQPTTVHQPTAGYDPNATVAYDPATHGTTVHPNAAYGAPVTYAPSGADDRSSNKGLAVIVGLVVALLFLGGGTLGLRALASSPSSVSASPAGGSAGGSAGGAAAPGLAGTTVAPTATTPVAPVTTAAPAPTTVPDAPAPKAPTGGGAPAPTNPPAPQPPAAPKPAITSFTTPETIDCHNGNFQQFTASWTTTNATKVSISIDGPGVYKYYPANGSDSLPFSCDTPHSFLLTAYGADGSTVSTSITLQPRNVQTPPAPGADDE